MLDSPFGFCKVCRGYVLLDQTHRECVREHGCGNVLECPLRRFFTGMEFGAKIAKAKNVSGRARDPASNR
jgi:hypothetical protein